METIEKLKEIINNSNNIVAFTGAGVSTLSGIKILEVKMVYIRKSLNIVQSII